MGYPVKNEAVILQPPIESVASLDYHEAIVRALNCYWKMLDIVLAQFNTRAAVFTEVAARLIEILRTGHKVLVAGNESIFSR